MQDFLQCVGLEVKQGREYLHYTEVVRYNTFMERSKHKECKFAAKSEQDTDCSYCRNTIKAGTRFCFSRFITQTFHKSKFYRTEYICAECFMRFREMEFLDLPAYIYGAAIPDDYITYYR